MKRRYKFLAIALGLAVVTLTMLALTLSHDSPCHAATAPAGDAARMKAIVYRCYGPPDVLKLEEIAKPVPTYDQVLVKVRAASVNPLDWHYMRGEPYFMRPTAGIGTPNDDRMSVDFAGTIESAGKNVKRFKPGDAVFGGRDGAFAEYVSVGENRSLAIMPDNMSF